MVILMNLNTCEVLLDQLFTFTQLSLGFLQTGNLGVKAFQEGMVVTDRKRLAQEAVEQEAADRKRRKTYLKDVANRPSTELLTRWVCPKMASPKQLWI